MTTPSLPIFVDASVVIHALSAPSPLKTPCRQILAAAAHTRSVFVMDAEVLQEVLHVLRSRLRWTDAQSVFLDFSNTVPNSVLPFDHRDVIRAKELAIGERTHVSTEGLLHVAVMERHGIQRVVSADRDYDTFPDITRLDPAALGEWADPDWFPKD